MSDTWLADLVIATAEWVLDAWGVAVTDIGGYVAAQSGAAHELEFYGGQL
jgi:hypothetical protein